MSKLNPKTAHREFSGVPGALGIATGLPVVLVVFYYLCNEQYSVRGITVDIEQVKAQLPQNVDEFLQLCFDKSCWAAYAAWFSILAVLDIYMPGKDIPGVELRDGTRLMYRINGKSMSGLLFALLSARLLSLENYYMPELQFLYDNQLKLTLTTIIASFAMSFFVYAISFIPLRNQNGVNTKERILAVPGNTGNPIYDWFIGRELNPRIGAWDIKLFCELRPGMLLLFLINLSCAHNQYQTTGKVTDAMILVNFLQAFYIFDGVLNEEGCLTMIDIATDGFGFMLAFGDLAWLPWSYSLQARYLALPQNYYELGYFKTGFILVTSFIGYYIFLSSNQQKSDFKNGKLDKMESISTPTGSKLLVDGWWKLSQHINYFGDWIIGWSWCLPTGSMTAFTYFYVIYFATLLIHRQTRDEAKCSEKYGKAWEEYQKRVPYKIVPYIY
ncbi:Delta(14)-sterol reductase [Metschnikowia aff. pulcherrima]|uniref:Delta(14)-sterol reductase n=1 Tax=Metschnikowia aff. pulcherrima TaxID=2163413 RepID=A0A4P6XJG6_9ASCO|nr:Delta(14)-sterol reductase [Metschnikowia aff. pulcherrima]